MPTADRRAPGAPDITTTRRDGHGKRVFFLITPAMREQADQTAASLGLTRSAFFRLAIGEAIDRHGIEAAYARPLTTTTEGTDDR